MTATPDRIVVVDDEVDIARLLEVNLNVEGFEVVTFTEARAAVDAVSTSPPDVVLLDVGMPEVTGIDITRSLRADASTAAVPIILLTAKATLDDRLVGLAAGADDYIVKPFEIEEVISRVRTALRRARQLRGMSPLTGLPGNFDIVRQLESLIAEGAGFALVHADLDSFKAYNDCYGFVRGDAAIRATASILVDALRALDGTPRFAGHIGGDDFAVIVPPEAVERYASVVVAQFDDAAPSLHERAEVDAAPSC